MLRTPRVVRRIVPALWLGVTIAQAQILNSERIEQTFGSYGIEVLYSDDELRLSNLYSEHAGARVTRTVAVVAYPREIEPAFAAEHRAILAGGSIGATFAAAGWEVVKSHHRYFSSPAPELSALMGVDAGTPLATHAYRLTIRNAEGRYAYAWIIETHHPDYLREADLTEIYGPEAAGSAADGRLDEVRELRSSGLRLLENASTFGQ